MVFHQLTSHYVDTGDPALRSERHTAVTISTLHVTLNDYAHGLNVYINDLTRNEQEFTVNLVLSDL